MKFFSAHSNTLVRSICLIRFRKPASSVCIMSFLLVRLISSKAKIALNRMSKTSLLIICMHLFPAIFSVTYSISCAILSSLRARRLILSWTQNWFSSAGCSQSWRFLCGKTKFKICWLDVSSDAPLPLLILI
jgi:hypothetical protein